MRRYSPLKLLVSACFLFLAPAAVPEETPGQKGIGGVARQAEDRLKGQRRASKEAKLAPGLEEAFEVPAGPKDAYDNPVRQGTDEKTGYPLEIRHKATGMHLVFIPAGEFTMGSPDKEKDRRTNEEQHKVTLTKPVYLGKYEVTQAEWKKVTGNSPSNFKGENNPVEQVCWEDCQEFLKRLNTPTPPSPPLRSGASSQTPTGQAPTPPLFCLPTEAQWEYACRAGTQTRFSFGDRDGDLGEYAWYSGNWDGKTHPVGGKKPNAWGGYDMHGNVWEWCEDWKAEYQAGTATDPKGPESGWYRVFRGGSWREDAADCRSALRYYGSPVSRLSIVGCRVCVRSYP
jgi:formylglycine-generating enzyme required for sulfatase activity